MAQTERESVNFWPSCGLPKLVSALSVLCQKKKEKKKKKLGLVRARVTVMGLKGYWVLGSVSLGLVSLHYSGGRVYHEYQCCADSSITR